VEARPAAGPQYEAGTHRDKCVCAIGSWRGTCPCRRSRGSDRSRRETSQWLGSLCGRRTHRVVPSLARRRPQLPRGGCQAVAGRAALVERRPAPPVHVRPRLQHVDASLAPLRAPDAACGAAPRALCPESGRGGLRAAVCAARRRESRVQCRRDLHTEGCRAVSAGLAAREPLRRVRAETGVSGRKSRRVFKLTTLDAVQRIKLGIHGNLCATSEDPWTVDRRCLLEIS
jgi:hypothetical protein